LLLFSKKLFRVIKRKAIYPVVEKVVIKETIKIAIRKEFGFLRFNSKIIAKFKKA